MSGYFDCACCGTIDIGEEGAPAFCDACKLCECSDTDPQCKVLLIDGDAGIYVPKKFADNFDPAAWGVPAEDIEILKAGPDHDLYWDTWSDVEGRVERDWDGKRWVLTQDGDLWALCVGKAGGVR